MLATTLSCLWIQPGFARIGREGAYTSRIIKTPTPTRLPQEALRPMHFTIFPPMLRPHPTVVAVGVAAETAGRWMECLCLAAPTPKAVSLWAAGHRQYFRQSSRQPNTWIG